jgi:GR25 family glycosyltransferase involved in LPS biosynthesis
MLFRIFGFLLLISAAHAYEIEGFYRDPIEKKIYLIDRFLTYNPQIVAINFTPEHETLCKARWPHATFTNIDPLAYQKDLKCNLLWIDNSEGAELSFFNNMSNLLRQATVVFTKTHFFHQGAYYLRLKQYLESQGFVFFMHWYDPRKSGEAIFVKKEMLDASFRSLNYQPTGAPVLETHFKYDLARFFKPADNKSSQNQIDGIDLIYMINLDERPEKFQLASENLHLYGIFPYRFSAVNGWKLPGSAFQELGVRFYPGMLHENFLGTTYRENNGKAYMSNEMVQENGESYFTLGMSPGAIGIVLSHLSILYDAFNSGYETIWVMEDDVEAVADPRLIPNLITRLDEQVGGDWDILFTDIDTKDGAGNHVACRAMAARPNVPVAPLSTFFNRFYSIGREFSRTGMRYGAYSMIVRRSGMQKILNYFHNYGIYLPYDTDFWLIPDIKMYCVNHDIVSHQAGAPSDNSYPFYTKIKPL